MPGPYLTDKDGATIRLWEDGIVTLDQGESTIHITDFRFHTMHGNRKVMWQTDSADCILEWDLIDQHTLSKEESHDPQQPHNRPR